MGRKKQWSTAKERRQLRRTLPPIDLNQSYPMEPDACAYLDCCKAMLYREIKARGIELVRRGRRSYISGADLASLARAPAPAAVALIPSHPAAASTA
jgi:hypothetical protein